MPFHLYRAWNTGREPKWLGIRIEYVEDRWVSTCHEADARGERIGDGVVVAPKFYGITAEQAHRRMLDVLEDTFDQVVAAAEGITS